jgi:tRNA 2-selenouridine synthase
MAFSPRGHLSPFMLARLLTLASASVAPPARALPQLVTPALFERAKRRAVKESYPDKLPLAEFLQRGGLLQDTLSAPPPIVDVRSPCEFAKGHIPGATNLPLFTDDERAEVGTLYKQKGHDVAVERGLEIVEESWSTMLAAAPPEILEANEVLVYCKRGGMRSGGVAWLLAQAPSLSVHVLQGGYAAFRGWALNGTYEEHAPPCVILGGRTGSGKTDVLHAMRHSEPRGQIVDLEGVANHRGSAFGSLGLPPQPTQQMYENTLALQWARLDASAPVFIEDEGAHVGSCGVPTGLWAHMRRSSTPIVRLEVPHQSRIDRLVREYGPHGIDRLSAAVRALAKRLGAARTDELLAHLSAEPPRLAEVADALATHYYDALYLKKLASRADDGQPVHELHCESGEAADIAPQVLAYADELLAARSHEPDGGVV